MDGSESRPIFSRIPFVSWKIDRFTSVCHSINHSVSLSLVHSVVFQSAESSSLSFLESFLKLYLKGFLCFLSQFFSFLLQKAIDVFVEHLFSVLPICHFPAPLSQVFIGFHLTNCFSALSSGALLCYQGQTFLLLCSCQASFRFYDDFSFHPPLFLFLLL